MLRFRSESAITVARAQQFEGTRGTSGGFVRTVARASFIEILRIHSLLDPRIALPAIPPSENAGAEPEGLTLRKHILTVGMEDYFQVGAFNELVQRGEWYRFESRVEHGTRRTLDILDEHKVRATFFVLGWVAEQVPELVREVADRGHEVASKGYYHRNIGGMTPAEFADDLMRARDAIERASGRRVHGYRVAGEWLQEADLWALDVLMAQGYRYDSSFAPRLGQNAEHHWRGVSHLHRVGDGSIWEFPVATMRLLGRNLPLGGNYLRQLPQWLVHRGARQWLAGESAPLVLYFHTWEMDADQPRISAARATQRLRHYRNLELMPERLGWFLREVPFTSIAEYLGLDQRAPLRANEQSAVQAPAPRAVAVTSRKPATRQAVTVVVPCFNEELILPYLANTLRSVEGELAGSYDLRFIFVDDCSTDGTAASLERLFGTQGNCRILRLRANEGPAGAILRGVQAAETDIVCSIDCDCTYDPHRLAEMIPLLTSDVAMVTASPYHPRGAVRNVPTWRLALSKNLSRLYRLVLRNQLATYTSCFRVYRRDAMAGMTLDRTGFLGVTEMLCRLDLAGHRIVEFPTTLEVRMLGRSKLRILRIIGGHLVMIARLLLGRVSGSLGLAPRARN